MNLKKYIYSGKGSVPIILSCPHDGFLKPKLIPTRTNGIVKSDKNTSFISRSIINKLREDGIFLYYIISKIHRCKVDFNRPPRASLAYDRSSKEAAMAHYHYIELIMDYTDDCVKRFGKCLFIDLHGFTKPFKEYPDIIFGNLFGRTLNLRNCSEKPKDYDYWGFFQLKQELERIFTLDDGLAIKNQNIAYSGGYITYQFLNKTQVNALQLEIAKEIRMNPKLLRSFVFTFYKAVHLILEECK